MTGYKRFILILIRISRVFIFSILILIRVIHAGFSQPWLKDYTPIKSTSQNKKFYQLQKAFNTYWSGKDVNAKGIGYKPFKRWEWIMSARVQDGINRNRTLWEAYQKISGIKGPQIQGNWSQLGPKIPLTDLTSGHVVGTGRIDCIAFHPTDTSVFWIGSPTGGLWKTIDGGQTWNPLTDNLPSIGIADIAIHPRHPDTIYIATGDRDAGEIYSAGVLKSTDGGATWSLTDLNFVQSDNFVVTRLLLNPAHPDTLVAATNKGIYFITKGGGQSTLALGGNYKDLEFKPGNPDIVYAASYSYGYSTVYKSVNAGKSFTESFSGVQNNNIRRIALAVSPSRPDWIYALCTDKDNSAFQGLYRSIDSGTSWETFTPTTKNLLGTNPAGDDTKGQGWYDLALVISPTDPAEVYVGGINIWKTLNSGASWNLVTYGYREWNVSTAPYIHVDQHALEINPLSGDLYSGNDGGIYRSRDRGTSWLDLSNGLEILQIYRIGASATRPDLILMGSQDNSSIKLIDSVFKVVVSGDGMECIVDYSDTNKLYVSSQRGSIKYSSDGGKNFTSIVPDDSDEGAWVTPYIMNPKNPDILYAGYSNLYMTRNRGQEWQKIASGVTGGKQYNALAIAPSDPKVIYTATKNLVWRTDDEGSTWTSIKTGLPNGVITYIAVSQYNPKEVWVTMSNYFDGEKVYTSQDGGATWNNYSAGLPNIPVNCIVYENNTNKLLYAGTDLGVFYRNKTMSQWESFSQGIPNVIVNELEIFYPDRKIRAGTYGRGLWESNLFQPDSLPLYADFTTDRYQGCLDGTFRLVNKSILNTDSIHWILSTDASPVFSAENDTVWVTYSQEGYKKIELIAYRNSLTDTISRPEFIKINSSMDITLYSGAGKYFWRGDTTLLEAFGAENYRWSPALGLSDTVSSVVYASPDTDVVYYVSATDGVCTDLDSLSITVFQNDKIRFATPLNYEKNGPFINFGASVEKGEPHPPLGNCNTQTDWCDEFGDGNGVLGNTVWFTFKGPPLGIVSIDSKGFDNQIAIYSAYNTDSILAGNFTILAANDDYYDLADNYAAAITEIDNLVEDKTYWVQVDGSGGNLEGTFYLTLFASPLSVPSLYQQPVQEYFTLFPNPNKGTFSIKIQNRYLSGKSFIEVFNLQGQMILNIPIASGNPAGDILTSIHMTVKGIFLVKVNTPRWTQVKKVLIQ